MPKRVRFLNCDGPANEGLLLRTAPCPTWSKMAKVKWDDGETTWVRHGDLTFPPSPQLIEDERLGFEAFPGGRFADAMRGTKSFPGHPRCPFRRKDRVEAWERGYQKAHDALIEAFVEVEAA